MEINDVDLAVFGMSEAYQRLLDRATETLSTDDRVVALLAVGSVGRGEADASSDLDLLAAIADEESTEAIAADWEALIARITPSMYRRLLGGRILTVVTPAWQRLDITLLPASGTGLISLGPATIIFDRVGIALPSPLPAQVITAADLVTRAENFIRSVGLMVTDLERGEHTVLTWASEFLINELVEVMFLQAGRTRRTLKRIYVDLPHADRNVLEGLQRPDTTPRSIIGSHLAIAAEFLPRIKTLIEEADGGWPSELEDATDRYLRANLGVGFIR